MWPWATSDRAATGMRIDLLAVHRLGRTAEAGLAGDYATRATAAGRSLALGPVRIEEVEGRKPGAAFEGEALLAAAEGAYLIICDEGGAAMTSTAFARLIVTLRDQGERRLAFAIGGADGLAPVVKARARRTIAFGPQTWPHALARVMLSEHIYLSVSILGGAPYHREGPV
jgi:23S rRNA (pseudouridine1915-N3)-methyltransferase